MIIEVGKVKLDYVRMVRKSSKIIPPDASTNNNNKNILKNFERMEFGKLTLS
jgi:hypothetical protein